MYDSPLAHRGDRYAQVTSGFGFVERLFGTLARQGSADAFPASQNLSLLWVKGAAATGVVARSVGSMGWRPVHPRFTSA